MNEFALPPQVEELREAAVRFAEHELAPAVRSAEADEHWSASTVEVVRGFALGGLDLPGPLGGADAGALAKVVLLEALAVGDPGGLPAVDQPGMATGALLACPDGALATAVAEVCLSGEAQCAFVVVDQDARPDGPPRVEWAPAWPPLRWAWVSEGDVLRLVEFGTHVERSPAQALGFKASGGVSVALDRGEARGEWSLGAGGGLAVRGRARLWSAAVAVGIGQAALDATLGYTTQRIVFGRPVAHHQGNAFELAGAATNLHGARLMVRDAATSFDQGDGHAGFWATQAWFEATGAAAVVTDLGIQLLGGHGFLVDHLAEKRFREARMLALLSGGRDAAATDVADAVLDVPDPLFDTVPS